MRIENSPLQRRNREYRYILIALILFFGILVFKQARPYLSGFLGACTLYVLLERQMAFLCEKWKLGKGFSAAIIVLETLLFFLTPLTGIAFLVIDTLSGITINPQEIIQKITDFAEMVEDKAGFKIFTPENLSYLPQLGTNIVQVLGSSIYSLIINGIVIIFVLYYMLLNYQVFGHTIKEILPFKEENKQILAEETKSIIQANAIGVPLLAIIQGFFAYGGYLFFGVSNALLYAILTAFATILPIVGTTIVWLPLGIAAIIGGDLVGGLGIIAYGFFVISTVDNVIRFILQKKLADIHPLITVFGVLIGVPMFGFWGVIFGPLLLSLFILFFNMYRYEYIPYSTAEPRVTTRHKTRKIIPGYKGFKKKKRDNP